MHVQVSRQRTMHGHTHRGRNTSALGLYDPGMAAVVQGMGSGHFQCGFPIHHHFSPLARPCTSMTGPSHAPVWRKKGPHNLEA